jgi:serine protease AprX
MLIRAPAIVLTEIAADPRVQRIDVPRLLEPEIDVSAVTINAAGYRSTHSLAGDGQIVAVLDSEIAALHPAFEGAIIQKQNHTIESWGHPHFHGTAVAGIIASRDAAFTGMAPGVTIYNYKLLAAQRALNATDFGGALALQQATEDGAHIANCSWGVGFFANQKSREARACDEAWATGMVVVKSAGNRGPGPGTMSSPADADGAIVVGATDVQGNAVQDYSSRGDHRKHPDLVAPGGSHTRGVNSAKMNGGFGDCGVGASWAAAHVSGLCALLLEQAPGTEPDHVKRRLLNDCRPLAGFGPEAQGAGLVVLQ